MTELAAVDRVEIRILVDNATDWLSSAPANVESELTFTMRRGLTVLSDCLCCATHRLSCLVTAERGGTRHTILFDSGPEEYAFERNTTRLGVDLGKTEGIVLSRGHWGHAGAMRQAGGGRHPRATAAARFPTTSIPRCFGSAA